MELRKICDDPADMSAWELAHNMMFVKDREACYRDFERETTLLDLVREIYRKHTGEDGLTQEMDELDDETLDEILADNLQYGTDDWDGVIALLYQTAWGAAELREWLKAYETHGLPTTMRPEVLQQAIDTYGSHAQEEMAIEEMSELTKAIVKRHRAADKPSYDKAMSGIAEEMAAAGRGRKGEAARRAARERAGRDDRRSDGRSGGGAGTGNVRRGGPCIRTQRATATPPPERP